MALNAIRSKSAEDAKSIVSSGVSALESMSAALSSAPYGAGDLAKAEAEFVEKMSANGGADVETPNAAVDALYAATRDFLSTGCDNVRTLERFIGLHHPQMEDGNNFGVTVQMTVAKYLSECRETWTKSLSESAKYYSGRADAIEKFSHLPSSSVTETKSSSSSNKDESGTKKDESSTSTSKEEKTTSSSDGANVHRIKSLAAYDAQNYAVLRSALVELIDGYAIVMDNFEKNMEKLEMPKGSGYSAGSGGSSMVY